ncbi:MAG: hypothetical protein ACLQMO_07045 [Acidobacteriaceae bacterium]
MRKLQCAVVGITLLFIPLNLSASVKHRLVGTVDFSGDPQFDADSISASGPNHWQWLSFPGGRLVLNPSPVDCSHIPPPLAKDIPLNLGGWVGTKTIKLLNISHVLVSTSASTSEPATSLSTTWFPYKFTFDADYPGNIQLHGKDFFTDVNSSLIRDLAFTSSADVTVELGGVYEATEQANWIPADDMLVVTAPDYIYAMKFARIVNGHAMPLQADAAIQPHSYELRANLEPGASEIAIGFGFATRSEGETTAVARAKQCFHQRISDSLTHSRAGIEGALRRVPAPQKWGIEAGGGSGAVTAAQHRRAYYAAWTFVIQDVVRKLPESSFAYDQLMTGKPSLWNEGDPRAPGTAQWDSVLGYQWLCYVDCKAAWSAFAGLMSLVGPNGAISGESLPSRKAQTAWILYSRTHDRVQLRRIYPALRKNLLWEEENSHWIYGDYNIADEIANEKDKDFEFTSSWIYDAGFASEISSELGDSSDAKMWRRKQAEMAENSRTWFFSDPTQIHQNFPFANRKDNSKAKRDKLIKEITQGLAIIQQFSPDIRERLINYFNQGFRPNQNGLGFEGDFRYPNMDLTAYGLIDIGRTDQAVSLITGVLRDSIRAGTFAEADNPYTTPIAQGVEESLFSPMNIIEFTWLLNGCRYDRGNPVYVNLTSNSRSSGSPLATK